MTKEQSENTKIQFSEIFKDVKEEFQTPEKLFALFRLIYSEYDENKKFGADFDIIDFVDYIIPYYKIECIQKAIDQKLKEDEDVSSIEQQINELKLFLIGKNAENENKKLDRFYAEICTQSDLEYSNYE